MRKLIATLFLSLFMAACATVPQVAQKSQHPQIVAKAIDPTVAKDVPTVGDHMEVVWVDSNLDAMVDMTRGYQDAPDGGVIALVLIVWNPAAQKPGTQVHSDSARVAINCQIPAYQILDDNGLDSKGQVIVQVQSPEHVEHMSAETVMGRVGYWVCAHTGKLKSDGPVIPTKPAPGTEIL